MNFSLTFETNLEIENQKRFIRLSEIMEEYFKLKKYGNDIEHFFIGVISVKPEFEQFFKLRKPKYQSVSKVKLLDGNTKELKGLFTYDIKLNYESLSNISNSNEQLLASKILESLSNLDVLPKKVKDFDKERFKQNVEHFFKEQNLL